ncbi:MULTISPECIES: 2-hydroxyacid dehydrogenase [unclassified Cupriavidus]|uniref:2-hydroxyacid dehydrogenase n=1 Tax=Cupriavidus sp. TaxID=1873897 RepID=UPI001CECCFB9|nr:MULTISPECIES: 2-hydroxyacid dehydrogenase [unclassified Cupriavidus]
MKTLVKIGDFGEPLQSMVDREFHCLSPAEAFADTMAAGRVEGILTRSNCKISPDLLDRFPALRIIATSGVGYDGIPVRDAAARGIVVTNTPGVLDNAVCELGMALLLGLLRDIPHGDRFVRNGDWTNASFPLTTNLHGMRVGIVGLGRIGEGMARRLEPFGVKIAYTSRAARAVSYEYFDSPLTLARQSDALILCCAGGEETHHLVDERVLDALSGGWLINIARGSVVDEAALCRALRSGSLRGAALDVFEEEPLSASPLRSLPNVVLSPHRASATLQTRSAMLRMALDNLHAVLAGGTPLSIVKL